MNLCGIFLYIYYFIFITHRYVEPTSSMNHFQHFNSRLRNSILRLFVFNEYYKEMKFKSMKHLLQMKENVHKKINNIESIELKDFMAKLKLKQDFQKNYMNIKKI